MIGPLGLPGSMNTLSTVVSAAGRVIGTGSFGTVYGGLLQGLSVAVKKITYQEAGPICDEVYACMALEHSNLVNTYLVYRRKASVAGESGKHCGTHDSVRHAHSAVPCISAIREADHVGTPDHVNAPDHNSSSQSNFTVKPDTPIRRNHHGAQFFECFIVQACPAVRHSVMYETQPCHECVYWKALHDRSTACETCVATGALQLRESA